MRAFLLPLLFLLAASPALLFANNGPAPARRATANAPVSAVAPSFQPATALAQTALPTQPEANVEALALDNQSTTTQPENDSPLSRRDARRVNRLQRFASRLQQLAPSFDFLRPAASGSGVATSGRMQVANTTLLIILLVVLVVIILFVILDIGWLIISILIVILLVLLILWLLKLL